MLRLYPMGTSVGVEYLLVGGVMLVITGNCLKESFPARRSSEGCRGNKMRSPNRAFIDIHT
jgi:hypothetical protein